MLPSTADKIENLSVPLWNGDKPPQLFTLRPSVDNEMAIIYNGKIINEKTLLVDGKFIPVNEGVSDATISLRWKYKTTIRTLDSVLLVFKPENFWLHSCVL